MIGMFVNGLVFWWTYYFSPKAEYWLNASVVFNCFFGSISILAARKSGFYIATILTKSNHRDPSVFLDSGNWSASSKNDFRARESTDFGLAVQRGCREFG